MTQSSEIPLTSAVERMPVGMWRNVLLRLDNYSDLKCARRVCRGWKELIDTPPFDSRLFRSPPDPKVKLDQSTSITLHPALDSIDFLAESASFVTLEGATRSCSWRGISAEMVTYPSSCTLTLGGFPGFDHIIGPLKDGVTIGDLVKRITSIWRQPVSEFDLNEYRRDDREGWYYWMKEEDPQADFDRNQLDFERYKRRWDWTWPGFNTPIGSSDGSVYIKADLEVWN